MQDERGGQIATSDDFPPTHPHTATSTESLLNRTAGFTGTGVGRGDHWSPRFTKVGCGPAHGKASDLLNIVLRMRRSEGRGIAKMFAVMARNKTVGRRSRSEKSDRGLKEQMGGRN